MARVLLEMFVEDADRLNERLQSVREDTSPVLWEGSHPPELTVQLFPVTNYEKAKAAFVEINALLRKALDYYVLDGYVTDHFKLLMDVCKLWATISIFEPDLSRKCKMHKRRAKLFEPLVGQLNPQYFGWQIQHMNYRLGEVYSDLAELKAEIKRRALPQRSALADTKINSLIARSLNHFEEFLKSCEGGQLGENEDAFIAAHFAIARLYGKQIGLNPREAIALLEKSLAKYRWIVAYVDKRRAEGACMKEYEREVDLAQQMIELLP
jgi:hypothetical protein